MQEPMKERVVASFDYSCPPQKLMERLGTEEGDELYDQAMEVLERVEGHIHPCFLLKDFEIGEITKSGFSIGDYQFSSRIAGQKLSGKTLTTLYIASCGTEIGQILDETTDDLDHFIVDQIAYLAYLEANRVMMEGYQKDWKVEKFIRLCPGSIIDWSVGDVCHFFGLLSGMGLYEQLGVRVLESGLIDPLKSTSGLLLVTDEEFESCSICPRINCESRREPFNLELHEQMIVQ